MTTHRSKILLGGWIATALIVLVEILIPTRDYLGFEKIELTTSSLAQTVLFSVLTMAGLHSLQQFQTLRRSPTFIGACVWFGGRFLGLLLSLIGSFGVAFSILAAAGALLAFFSGILVGSFKPQNATGDQDASSLYDTRAFRGLWVCIVLGTGLILLAFSVTDLVLSSPNLDASLLVRDVVTQIGPQIIISVMLIAIPLHVRLKRPAVLIPLALFVVLDTLPMFVGMVGFSVDPSSILLPASLTRTTFWWSTLAWVVAVLAIIVTYSRIDKMRAQELVQPTPQVSNPD